MTFRTRLLLVFTLAVVVAVGLVELLVIGTTRQTYERMEAQRVTGLTTQFRKEFERRAGEIERAVNAIAQSEPMRDIALRPDPASWYNEAGQLAASHRLDLLELVSDDATIVSSAEWPARFGYKEDWLASGDWKQRGAFLRVEELRDGMTLSLVAVGTATAGDRKLYVAGGEQLARGFVASLVPPEGMQVLLYRSLRPGFTPAELIDANGPASGAENLRPVIEAVRHDRRETQRIVGSDTWHALPLMGYDNTVLGVLLIGSSRLPLAEQENSLVWSGIVVATAGILMGLAVSWWAAARITRPVHRLAESAGKVAAGDWNASVEISSADEIGQLARAFNRMTGELVAQRERLVQAERVAAWRELARRLAHELKNPLFPLQITVENMQRARERYPDQFDEVFREGSATLLA